MDVFYQLKEHNEKVQNILKTLQQTHKETDFNTALNYLHKTDKILTLQINKNMLSKQTTTRNKPTGKHLSEFKQSLLKS
ncbi:MAG: hypothetical protein CMO44_17905 [Verrucomicrobiales bacterium]|nr:hypothetical protein [Verrucomicrobiales bacterium]